jgi:lipopolysaccharide transport system ATP-binding protein
MSSLAEKGREPAILVEGIGKRYRLGANAGVFNYGTLRETVANVAGRQRRRLRGLWSGVSQAAAAPDYIWALSDVSLRIDRGEVVGIIGANGAGKSTLLKILSRITKPTVGAAELRGRIGTLLEVGTGFHPELSGRDNIHLSGTILGMRRSEIQRRFDEIVEFAGIGRFIDTPVKRYSSGMYVRLAFAVAAHLEPEILLVDEVLAVGDAEFQKKCLGKMQNVVREGRTVLFVSHNMAAIKGLCPRAIWFAGGRVAADGHADDVVDRYLAGSAPAAVRGEVPANAPRVGSGEARVIRVALQNRRGADVERVYYGQPIRVVLTLAVSEPVRDAIAGVGISAVDGTRVATSHSTDGGRPALSLPRGEHRIAVDLDVTLLPHTYTLDVTVVRSDGYDIDSVNRVLDFTAMGVAESGGDRYPWDTVRGFVRPAAVWHDLDAAPAADDPFARSAEPTSVIRRGLRG